MREILILLVGIMFILSTPTHANSTNPITPFSSIEQDSLAGLPKVFLLGNHEIQYETEWRWDISSCYLRR